MKNTKVADFKNTEIAFAYKSDRQLRLGAWIFRLMNHPVWVDVLSTLGIWGVKLRFPPARFIIRKTVYTQFVGGADLQETEEVICLLRDHHCLSILDYAVEGKHEEHELDEACNEFIKAIRFAATQDSMPVITVKMSALARNSLLESWRMPERQEEGFDEKFERVYHRIDNICSIAAQDGISIFIDAEESWYQDAIDYLAGGMMQKYNQDKVVVYNTYQLYRTDRLDFLQKNYEMARKKGYLLGAKLVRGAYMDHERERAKQKKYQSPILPDKPTVDRHYNTAVLFCADRYEYISMYAATHNLISSQLLADRIESMGIQRDHPHLNFCQLYGMGDDMTFNLAAAGYNAAKYLPYGPVMEVLPYLIRRIEENKAMSNEFNREYKLIQSELKRRKQYKNN